MSSRGPSRRASAYADEAKRKPSRRSLSRRSSLQNLRQARRELRSNPCKDDQVFKIFSEAVQTEKVGFFRLFRYARFCDYTIMSCGFLLTIFTAAFFAYNLFRYSDIHTIIIRSSNRCDPNWDPIPVLAIPLVVAGILIVCTLLSGVCFQVSAVRQVQKLRLAYVEALARKDQSWFDVVADRDLTLRMTSDVSEIKVVLGKTLPRLVFNLTASALMIVTYFPMNWLLASITTPLIPLLALSAYMKTNADKTLKKKETELFYETGSHTASELMASIKTIKLFGGEAKAVKLFKESLFSPGVVWKTVLWVAFLSGLTWFIPMIVCAGLCIIAISYEDQILLKVYGVNHSTAYECLESYVGYFDAKPLFPQLDVILLYVIFASHFVSVVPILLRKVSRAQFILAEMFFTIDSKPAIDNLSEAGLMHRQKLVGQLRVENVNFSYPLRPLNAVLSNLSLSAIPGQIVTLFGPSKSGKTTILSLLLRMYDTCEGTIQWDGEDIVSYSVPWLRSQIGFVSQKPTLLNGTIRENICGFGNAPDTKSLELACEKANVLNDILDLAKGFDTLVGEPNNVYLTHVQIKKIFLARAFFRKCKIYLLDQFFDDMDFTEEPSVWEQLEELRDKCTIIYTCRNFIPIMQSSDIIYVLKDGAVVQYGNHQNLLQNHGMYSTILKETLVDADIAGDGAQPKVDSQLAYYKFGAAIKRMHDIHDRLDCVDYHLLKQNPLPVDSILLRHCVGGLQRLSHPRLLGGFYKLVNFQFEINADFEKNVIRSNLLRERDLRCKIFPNIYGSAGFGAIPSSVKDQDGLYIPIGELLLSAGHLKPSLSSAHIDEFAQPQPQNKNLRLLAGKIGNQKISKGRFVQSALIKEVADSNRHRPSSNARTKAVGGMRRSKTSLTIKPEVRPKLGEDGARLRHYFGLPVNSEADAISISSEDSYNFWDLYTARFLVTMHSDLDREKKCSKFDIFRLAKYAWFCLVVSFLTGSCLGLVLNLSIREYAIVAENYLLHNPDEKEVMLHSYHLAMIAAVGLVVSFIQEVILGFGILHANNNFRVSFFGYILQQDIAWFDEPRNDICLLCEHLAADIPDINTAFTTMIALSSEAAMIGWGIAWILLEYRNMWPEQFSLAIVIPMTIMFNFVEGRRRAECKRFDSDFYRKTAKVLVDLVQLPFDVISMGLSKQLLDKFNNYVESSVYPVRHIVVTSIIFALSEYVFFFSFSIYCICTVSKLQKSREQVGNFLVLLLIILNGVLPMGHALATIPSIKEISDSAAAIIEVECAVKSKYQTRRLSLALGELIHAPGIKLVDVKFEFANSAFMVLKGVTLEILPQSYVAVVGPAQSGKSTLISLLQRLYTPTKGTIFFGEQSYDDIEESYIHRAIAVVEQDPDLFPYATIEENIAYGDNSRIVRSEEIMAAAKIAFIHQEVDGLSDGYHTKLEDLPPGPESFALRQRIAVARAAIRNPKVVIVDDATVSTSKIATKLLFAALMKLRDGIVAEQGTDTELLATKGVYYDLVMSQRLYEKQPETEDQMSTLELS